jgi:1-phosphatidylinositol-3-phosphate 5-kinase
MRSFWQRVISWITREFFVPSSSTIPYSCLSLLLGVDQERKQIACGLVDTIGASLRTLHRLCPGLLTCCLTGSYTFAKTLEYKAKQGLTGNSGKEVTVMPPTEYQDRFVSALDGYFVACPGAFPLLRFVPPLILFPADKWSRAMDDTKTINDPGMLPSVL